MKKFQKYLMAMMITAGLLFLFTLIRIPAGTIKVVSVIEKTFRQAVIKEKPPSTEGYDIITSASIRAPDFEKES